jgi:hypothetical protein
MAKSREKTQQIGFWDSEVSKADHDTVCIWAYENADAILRATYPEIFDVSWRKDEIDLDFATMDQDEVNKAREFAKSVPRPNPQITKKTIEFVLKSYTGYHEKYERIVGYADLVIETKCPSITPVYKSVPMEAGRAVLHSHSISWGRREGVSILVEAKSVLPTIGELMRQINLYRTAFIGRFVVVAPDDKYAEILTDQGVKFIQYKPLKTE